MRSPVAFWRRRNNYVTIWCRRTLREISNKIQHTQFVATLWHWLNTGKYLVIRIIKELFQDHTYLLPDFFYTEWSCENHRILRAWHSSTTTNIFSTGRCRGWLWGGGIGLQWWWFITSSPGRVITWRWSRCTAPRLPTISWNILHLFSTLSQTYSRHSKVSTFLPPPLRGRTHERWLHKTFLYFKLSLFPFYEKAHRDHTTANTFQTYNSHDKSFTYWTARPQSRKLYHNQLKCIIWKTKNQSKCGGRGQRILLTFSSPYGRCNCRRNPITVIIEYFSVSTRLL